MNQTENRNPKDNPTNAGQQHGGNPANSPNEKTGQQQQSHTGSSQQGNAGSTDKGGQQQNAGSKR
jgi:hypothetical protein